MTAPNPTQHRHRWRRLIPTDSTILLAVSGGADSVFMLQLFQRYFAGGTIKLYAAHVNHGVRGEEADRDARFVAALCNELKIPCSILMAAPPGSDDEGSLRTTRLTLLKEHAESIGARYLALGHQLDDVAETFLLMALRGSGPRGLGGLREIEELPNKLTLIHPLLEWSRAAIRQELTELGKQWCEDHTNESAKYRRNRLRQSVLPLLEEIEPASAALLARSAELCTEMAEWYRREAQRAFEGCVIVRDEHAILLNAANLRAHDPELHFGIISAAARRLRPQDLPSDAGLDWNAMEALRADLRIGGNAFVTLRSGIFVHSSYKYLLMGEVSGGTPADHYVRIRGELPYAVATGAPELDTIAALIKIEEFSGDTALLDRGERSAFLDADALSGSLELRPVDRGEVVTISEGHTKLVKDALSDAGVPAVLRDRMLGVFDGATLLWIPGVRRSMQARVTPETTRVLRLTKR